MATLPVVTVTGTVHAPDGSMYNGTILFRQPYLIRHNDGTVVAPGTVVGQVVNGALSVVLLYTDASGWTPSGWAWEVEIKVGSVPHRYSLSPLTADNNVNLGDLTLTDYVPAPGTQFAPVGHTHADLVTDAELASALAGLSAPDLSGYVTDSELTAALAGLSAPDLSGYATDGELSTAVTDLHTYADSGDAAVAFTANTAYDQSVAAINAVAGKANTVHTHAQADVTGLTTALSGKAAAVHTHAQSDVTNLVSDLSAKAPLASPTFTGTVAGITATMVGLGNVNNTSDAGKPISTLTQTALDAKQADVKLAVYQDIYGPPTTGTWTTGTMVMTKNGVYRCTAGGTPGTWVWLTADLGSVKAGDHSLAGWTFDPVNVQAGTILATAGLSYVARIRAQSSLITNMLLHLTAGGAGLTNGFATLHSDAGVLLGAGAVTADQSTSWQSGGLKTMALVTPQAVNPGDWLRMRWWFTGTTGPTLSRAVNSSGAIVNAGMTAPTLRYSTADASLTNLASAPNTIGTQTSAPTAFWAGLS